MKIQILVLLLVQTPLAASFDLGGPCKSPPHEREASNIISKIWTAEKYGNPSEVVDLWKQAIRLNCEHEYRWVGLLKAFVKQTQYPQAIHVLEEIYNRKNSFLESYLSSNESEKFRASSEYQASSVPKKRQDAKAKSEQRKTATRDRIKNLPATAKPSADLDATPAQVVFEKSGYGLGEIVFIVQNEGEGIVSVWNKGDRRSEDVTGIQAFCLFPSPKCWVETLGDRPIW